MIFWSLLSLNVEMTADSGWSEVSNESQKAPQMRDSAVREPKT